LPSLDFDCFFFITGGLSLIISISYAFISPQLLLFQLLLALPAHTNTFTVGTFSLREIGANQNLLPIICSSLGHWTPFLNELMFIFYHPSLFSLMGWWEGLCGGTNLGFQTKELYNNVIHT